MDSLREQSECLIDNIMTVFDNEIWKDALTEFARLKNSLVSDEKPQVAVVGAVKAGKSSFMNALLRGDYAPVGATETTATLNFFHGEAVPKGVAGPVKCNYTNGTSEWRTTQHFAALQGHDEQSLRMARDIESLEFFAPDARELNDIVLVDTPGMGSIVQEHQDVSEQYLGLYKELKENREAASIKLCGQAAAVIYAINHAATQHDQDNLVAFANNLDSAFSILVVVTQIDRSPGLVNSPESIIADLRKNLSSKLGKKLADIIPVSSSLQRFCDCPRDTALWQRYQVFLQELASKIERVFSSDERFLKYFLKEQRFCEADYRSLTQHFEWSAFKLFSIYLATHTFEESLEYIRTISGFRRVDILVNELFVKQARRLRYMKIINGIYGLLNKMKQEWPNRQADLSKYHSDLDKANEIVTHLQGERIPIRLLQRLVNEQYQKISATECWQDKLNEFRQIADKMRLEYAAVDTDFEIMRLVIDNKLSFSQIEQEVLRCLLGLHGLDVDSRLPRPADYLSLLKMLSGHELSPENPESATIDQYLCVLNDSPYQNIIVWGELCQEKKWAIKAIKSSDKALFFDDLGLFFQDAYNQYLIGSVNRQVYQYAYDRCCYFAKCLLT